MTGRRSRARWIAILCAVVAACVGAAGIPEAVRFLREWRAIRAPGSDVAEERNAAVEKLASIGTARALRGSSPADTRPGPL